MEVCDALSSWISYWSWRSAVIKPQSSAELAMIMPYADQHNILIISQGSTASSLAIANDSIFRFCPSDIRGRLQSPR